VMDVQPTARDVMKRPHARPDEVGDAAYYREREKKAQRG
jgi:hypothetical protein